MTVKTGRRTSAAYNLLVLIFVPTIGEGKPITLILLRRECRSSLLSHAE